MIICCSLHYNPNKVNKPFISVSLPDRLEVL